MLTKQQLSEIKELQNKCEQFEPLKLKLNWDMLASREDDKRNDFLHYENGKLVGFLGIYGFGNKVELCGMVDPEYRRKGIFTKLFNKASDEIKSRHFRLILLNAPASSLSAKGFLANIPHQQHMTEYQMKWEGDKAEVEESGVTLRKSTESDVELEITLEVACFGFLPEEAREFNQQVKSEGSDEFYIVESEGVSVGKLRVGRTGGEAWIYGFAVLPDYQGKGIGRKALKLTVAKEVKEGYPVFLEVEAKNANALRLYESCGFQTFHAQEYYELLQ
ncbi:MULTISPECIES: GNAT family N-acetyltransferase [unclassified Bacillus (in: firmicutes)]|uniref:GNAT family N-acetyltransferase n=1 Tax=unclassified Bacillus (in: firmicutes) TaxID=185979 RepID=UPI0008F45035|nr:MULTISPECIES: GNAT family N-acetyltransferase [unclassified Bacillus (in: firmicutes)]SFB13860.1 Ribosomal protein S18 acetylase RimI [Bacillus sp. UNCCL13]SFQ89890.1 Ribosomal protein S18 acetylase RimI [Bacillus sp. cl95]